MKISKTEGGMTYILYPLKTEYIVLGAITAFGEMNENKKHSAHTLEHMLFEGTKTKNNRDIAEILGSNAVEYNATTRVDTIDIYTLGAARKTDILIDLNSDLIQNSIFPSERLEKEKGPIKNEINAEKSDGLSEYYTDVYKKLYGNKGAGKRIMEWAQPPTNAEIDALTVEDLKQEYDRGFAPENMVFIAYGKMDVDKISKTIEDKFSSFYKKGTKRDFSEIKPLGKKKEIVVESPKTLDSKLGIFIPTTGFRVDNQKERFAISIAANLLNRNLYKTLRQENGLVYYVGVESEEYMRFGTLIIGTESSPNNFSEVKRLTEKELDKIHNGDIDSDYIKSFENENQDKILVSRYLNPVDTATRIALLDLQAKMVSGYENYGLLTQKPIEITIDDIREVCDKYINLDRTVSLSFVNKKT